MKNSDAYIWPYYLFGSIATFYAVALTIGNVPIPDTVENFENLFRIIGFFWFTGLVAHTHGLMDGKKIRYGISINHYELFIKRCLWIGSAALIMQVNVLWMIPAAFLFSTIFNLTLNDDRGKRWFYISNSNVYDRVFLAIFNAQFRNETDIPKIIKAGKTKVITEASLSVILFVVVLMLGV